MIALADNEASLAAVLIATSLIFFSQLAVHEIRRWREERRR